MALRREARACECSTERRQDGGKTEKTKRKSPILNLLCRLRK
jgi:hypothetical protein